MKNKLAVLGLLVAAVSVPTLAEKADRDKPIEISADNGTLDQAKGVTVWEGNVIVTQGTLKISADRVVVTRDPQGNQTLQATGKRVNFRQKTDNKDEWIEGQGSRLDYNSVSHQAVLTGAARIKRGEDLVAGEVINYNTETEMYQVNGGAPGTAGKGRVTVILQPKSSDGQKKP